MEIIKTMEALIPEAPSKRLPSALKEASCKRELATITTMPMAQPQPKVANSLIKDRPADQIFLGIHTLTITTPGRALLVRITSERQAEANLGRGSILPSRRILPPTDMDIQAKHHIDTPQTLATITDLPILNMKTMRILISMPFRVNPSTETLIKTCQP